MKHLFRLAQTIGLPPSLSLSLILKLTYTSQIVLAVGVTGWLSLRNGRLAVHQLALDVREEMASQVSQHIESQLKTAQQLNQTNAAAIAVGMLPLNDFELMGQYFWRQMQIYDVGYINFANERGEFIGVERTADNQFLINETQAAALKQMQIFTTDNQGNRLSRVTVAAPDPVTQEGWYAAAATARTPVWSDIYQWDDQPDVLSISASYPLYDADQKLLGVIGVDLVVSQMSQFLRALTQDQSGTIFVMEPDGMLIASSSVHQSYRLAADTAQRLKASESLDPVIRATAQQLQDPLFIDRSIPQNTSFVFTWEGVRHYVNINPCRDSMGLDWLIVTVVPETEFIGQINQNTRITILMCLLAAAIAVLSCLLTSRWINQPIQNLVTASQAISQGAPVPSLRNYFIQEFERLNQTFNTMANQLKAAFAQMENQVAQRTAELVTAKQQAEIANQSKTRFLAKVSQELRAPLNVILGFTKVILDDAQMPNAYQDAIWRIHQSGQSLITLMNAISQITRLEEEVGAYDVCFNLNTFLETLYTQLQPTISARHLNLTFNSLTNLPQFIYTDELKLHDIIINLVENIVECLQQGHIILTVSAQPIPSDADGQCQHVNLQFDIESFGLGIPIFDTTEFAQDFTKLPGDCALNQGSEIGLYISREYVRLLGGELLYKAFSSQRVIFRFVTPVKAVKSFTEIPRSTVSSCSTQGFKQRSFLTQDDGQLVTLSRELLTMPPDWLEQLKQAALKGSDSVLEQLIEQIPMEYLELIHFLRTETLSFRFDSILDVINAAYHEAAL